VTVVLDASSPAAVWNPSTATSSTASFTPPANSLLVVCMAGNMGSGTSPPVPSITDSLGAHLTYTLIDHSARPDTPATDGQTAMWSAPVSASAPMTVTVTNNASLPENALKVWVFTDEFRWHCRSSGPSRRTGPRPRRPSRIR
jgi:hypothetical protein